MTVLETRWGKLKPALDGKGDWCKVRLKSKLPTAVAGIYFTSSLTVWWRSRGGQKVGYLESEAVKDDVWRIAKQAVQQLEVTYSAVAQTMLNRVLATLHCIDDTPVEWIGYGRLSVSMRDRLNFRMMLRLRRAESLKRMVVLDEVELLGLLTKRHGVAALWWAAVHPDKLHYLRDDSFRALLNLQPQNYDYSISEASDESSQVIREFLSHASNPETRDLLARPLRIANEWARQSDDDLD
ncbi:hypothetical protein [Micromonospora haikouensis]|uniref:hypothetical protein n=1 Tax=Micromonospora haikouensis TaxID=686309 RepID=UPI003D72767D